MWKYGDMQTHTIMSTFVLWQSLSIHVTHYPYFPHVKIKNHRNLHTQKVFKNLFTSAIIAFVTTVGEG